MLFCLDSSASVVSLLYIGFLIWYQFSSIASLSSLFLEFSEGWETVFKFQLEIFLFRCLLHVAWWSLGVFQDLLVCLCVSLAWVSLLQSNSWWSDAASASASASLVALTSCSFLLNRLAMEMWSVWFSIFWGSIQSGDGKTLPPMVKLLLAHRFYIHFSFSFIVPMPIGSDYVKIDFMCSEIYTSGCRIQLSFTKLSMISTNMRDKSFDIVTNKQWSGQTNHGVILAEFGSVQPSFFTGKRFYFFKLL